MRPTPTSLRVRILSSLIKPREQQMLMPTFARISFTASAISWISLLVGPRPLLTMQ